MRLVAVCFAAALENSLALAEQALTAAAAAAAEAEAKVL